MKHVRARSLFFSLLLLASGASAMDSQDGRASGSANAGNGDTPRSSSRTIAAVARDTLRIQYRLARVQVSVDAACFADMSLGFCNKLFDLGDLPGGLDFEDYRRYLDAGDQDMVDDAKRRLAGDAIEISQAKGTLQGTARYFQSVRNALAEAVDYRFPRDGHSVPAEVEVLVGVLRSAEERARKYGLKLNYASFHSVYGYNGPESITDLFPVASVDLDPLLATLQDAEVDPDKTGEVVTDGSVDKDGSDVEDPAISGAFGQPGD